MAIGTWVYLRGRIDCEHCGARLDHGDDVYQTKHADYCSEACADEHESRNEGLMGLDVCDYPD
jgi:hypothetical protein